MAATVALTIAGRVNGDVVAFNGRVELRSGATVTGDVVSRDAPVAWARCWWPSGGAAQPAEPLRQPPDPCLAASGFCGVGLILALGRRHCLAQATRASLTGPAAQTAYCSGAATNRWWHASEQK
jgi:hypothetical protein